ncbi:SusC/RagA family TonB-linked outer membrane protein [Flavobacterium sp. MAH-1]|uniref:SusC/RagA family TonB-linked outer membrane protein n=1 Tax=Flavobacterium agri TaxID=2743471 RepID=A0A7Y8Y3K7_9FLAO|nr:SusC/RagA family TonB-linked outer membrane protein [Flavobacterium agri]NUY81847.1 SusC/RagA family TonB-linked outer membrane protein [Flavobacterium agri]NYA71871.1 SusC/RagA family TonB-linked outer membrane protein [Flavobacterium agri]
MRSKFKWIFTLVLALTMQLSFAQGKTVTGTVSDASGPLPGANVVVKETKAGVQTDVDGKFAIKVDQGQTLVFSFVGMADKEVKVGASNSVNVKLAEGGIALGEVVVTGALGIQKKANAQTYSAAVVKSEQINQAAQPNAVLALVGKVSGLQINTTNTGVNSSTRVVLRGNRSLTQSSEALVVIDNAISSLTAFQQIPPEQIENVNVIKGAQGAALYGQQGGNGVIVVTTKKGSKGSKPTVQLTSSIDFEEVAYVPQRQRRYGQGWSGQHINYENGAWGAEFDGVMRPTGLQQADGSFVMAPYRSIKDNIKEFFQTGTIAQNGVSISAGDENGYASLLANRQATDFVVEGDQLKRNAFIFRAGKKLGKWSIDGNASYTTQKIETTSPELYRELLQAATNIPVERFARPFNQYHWTSYYNSPYWTRENIRNESRQDRFRGQVDLGYKFNDNISARYTFNVNQIQSSTLSYTNEYIDLLKVGGGDQTTISSFDTSNSMARNIYADFIVNFDYELTEKIGFKLNIGNNMQDQYFSSSSVGGDNLTVPGVYNVSNVTGIPRASNTRTRIRTGALFANLDLDYANYLFLNATARNDWSSRLDSSTNSFFYPSVGLSFVPTNAFESLKDNKVLSRAKVYVNLTKNGNDGGIDFADIFDNYVQATGYAFGDLNSFVQSTTGSYRYLKPEIYFNKEVGINLEFFEGRLTLDAAYFRSDNKDLITAISPSYASGLTSLRTNIGKAHTTGGEIDLGFTPIAAKDFNNLGLTWTNRFSYSRAITVVDEVSAQADEVGLQNFASAGLDVGTFAVKGEEFPLIKGIGYERDDQGRIIIDPATGNPIKTTEYINLGKSTPDYILTYNTSVQFKGFQLSATMDYRTGHQFYSSTKQWLSWSGHLYDSALTGRTGFVFPNSSYESAPGVYTANTNIITGGTTYGSYLSYFQDEYAETEENFVLDATAFKVRELSLSYSFQKDMLDRLGLTALRLGINARNPFVVLPKENRNYNDPEQSRSTLIADQGLSVVGQYPVTRTYGFTVNVTF